MQIIKKHIWAMALLLCVSCASSGKNEVREQRKDSEQQYAMALNYYNNRESAQALRSLTMALESDPENADAWHVMGFIRMGLRQYNEAIEAYNKALSIRPNMLTCRNNLGVAYLHMEEWQKALEIFEELSHNPLYSSPWLAYANMGWANYKLGNLAKAKENTEMALFLNPDMCLAMNNLGIILLDTGDETQGVRYFEDSLRHCPSYAEPHYHLGIVDAKNGRLTKASTHFRRCVELSPRNELGDKCRDAESFVR